MYIYLYYTFIVSIKYTFNISNIITYYLSGDKELFVAEIVWSDHRQLSQKIKLN